MEKQICSCSCACTKKQSNPSTERWKANFFEKQHGIGTIPDPLFVDTLEQIDNQRELHDAFLSVSEISGSSWEVEQVQRFFREARAVSDTNIWIDFRQDEIGTSRRYSKWIASDQLAEVATRQVCLLGFYATQLLKFLANRMVIIFAYESTFEVSFRNILGHNARVLTIPSFVPYVSPWILEDMLKSATPIDIEALRQATFQYFSGETLMRVHTSVSVINVQRSNILNSMTRPKGFPSFD